MDNNKVPSFEKEMQKIKDQQKEDLDKLYEVVPSLEYNEEDI